MKRPAVILLALLAVLLLLFDVDIRPEFAWPGDASAPDPEQEQRYLACVAERDRAIHAETFERIDNPDVQREVLATRKDRAKRECRDRFPTRTITVSEPFRFNLLDVRFRY
ncbi:MAG: hypothetical protein OEW35_09090 [Gammaproteobacteria bacterium]|nr:hypothetical protein [Gammaproteobacteria bacterium]MDH4253618.1 hypothetical protein [Gammaproteobacteria bacterium]MDH5310381.1 hypothetical protein [Gammaproteobacteria bacterium]